MDLSYRFSALTATFLLLNLLSNSAYAVAVSGQGTWESTLHGRDLDGDRTTFEAYYDTSLDITWLADANYVKTSGRHSNGRNIWFHQNNWANNLDVHGVKGWRLPTIIDTGNIGCDYSDLGGTDCGYNVDTGTSEMAHLWFETLGNLAYNDTSGNSNQPGWGLTNTGPFENLQDGVYWSGTEYAPNPVNEAWAFNAIYGYQGYTVKSATYYAWAVRSGDVGHVPIPVPAAVMLFSSGLIGLLGLAIHRER